MNVNKIIIFFIFISLIPSSFGDILLDSDFSDGTVDSWTIVSGLWSAVNETLIAQSYSGTISINHSINELNLSLDAESWYWSIDMKTGAPGSGWADDKIYFDKNNSSTSNYIRFYSNGLAIGSSFSGSVTTGLNSWYRVTLSYNPTTKNIHMKVYNISSGYNLIYDTNAAYSKTINANQFKISPYGQFGSNYGYYDNIYVATGATGVPYGYIYFNKSSYKNYENGLILWILNSYSIDYEYKIEIRNANTGIIKSTHSIFGATGNFTEFFGDYDGGGYYAVLSSKKIEPPGHEWVDQIYAYTTIITVVSINGNIYNAENGSLINSANINTTQSGIWYNTTSNSLGAYSLYDYESNIAIGMNASKTNYIHVPISWTPLTDILYNINLYMFPVNNTRGSYGVQGVVYDDHEYQAIANANVTISNATWNNSTISNSLGYYNFTTPDIGNYTITAHKSGTANDVNYTINITNSSTWVIQNIVMALRYSVIVSAIDASTTSPIVSFMSCANSICYNTTTGSNIHYLPYGVYYIVASASGYNGGSTTQLINTDKSITIPLSKSATGTTSTLFKTLPHNVRFQLQDYFGNPQQGVYVTAQGYNTTTGSFDILSSLIGLDFINTPINNETMSGYTGTDGSISFMMDATIYYKVNFTKSPNINITWGLYPKEDFYFIMVSSTGLNPTCSNIYYNLTNTYKNATHNTLGLTYSDPTNSTSVINFYVQNNTGTYIYQTSIANTSVWSPSFDVNSSKGNTYFWGFNATTSSCSALIVQGTAFTFKGSGRFIDLHIDDAWYQWLSILGIVFIAAMFSARKIKFAAVVVPFSAGLFSFFGWFTINSILLGSSMVIGILIYIRMSEVKVNF